MTSEIIERVAGILWNVEPMHDKVTWDVIIAHDSEQARSLAEPYRGKARAVLQALRSPTKEMMVAAGAEWDNVMRAYWYEGDLAMAWTDAIDCALSPSISEEG